MGRVLYGMRGKRCVITYGTLGTRPGFCVCSALMLKHYAQHSGSVSKYKFMHLFRFGKLLACPVYSRIINRGNKV